MKISPLFYSILLTVFVLGFSHAQEAASPSQSTTNPSSAENSDRRPSGLTTSDTEKHRPNFQKLSPEQREKLRDFLQKNKKTQKN